MQNDRPGPSTSSSFLAVVPQPASEPSAIIDYQRAYLVRKAAKAAKHGRPGFIPTTPYDDWRRGHDKDRLLNLLCRRLTELSKREMGVLVYLICHQPGRETLTMTEIAGALKMSKPKASRTISNLARCGMIVNLSAERRKPNLAVNPLEGHWNMVELGRLRNPSFER